MAAMSHSDGSKTDAINGGYRKAKTSLDIIIVGAGISGLALAGILGHSGHKVTVLEGARKIAEAGAGIYASPNLTRLLSRWNVDQDLCKHTDPLSRIELRRWETGEKLGSTTLMPEIERRHGAPQYVVHRADLHKALLKDAAEVAELRVNSIVVNIDFEQPSVTLENGSQLHADIIVGADGMKSTCRRLMYQKLNLKDEAKPTGDAAFRALIPVEDVRDPDLRAFMMVPKATRWIGPGRHIQAYPIRHGALYNMVLVHPDDARTSVESWVARASKQEIIDQFGEWDPRRLRKLIDLIPAEGVMKWRLCEHEILPTWVMGKVVLMGDACHPMLPYVGQGAAQAVEDAGVLALALNKLSGTDEAFVVLKTFELVRKARTEKVVRSSGITRTILHLPDGIDQEERDEKFRGVSSGGENPDLLGDYKSQAFLWSFDPEKDYLDRYEDLLQQARALFSA